MSPGTTAAAGTLTFLPMVNPGRTAAPASRTATSAMARAWPSAPKIRSRLATGSLPTRGGDGGAPLAEDELGQHEVPLGVDIGRCLEPHHHAAVIVAQDMPLLHQHVIARDVHRARGLIDGRRVLAPHVLVAVVEEGHGVVPF